MGTGFSISPPPDSSQTQNKSSIWWSSVISRLKSPSNSSFQLGVSKSRLSKGGVYGRGGKCREYFSFSM